MLDEHTGKFFYPYYVKKCKGKVFKKCKSIRVVEWYDLQNDIEIRKKLAAKKFVLRSEYRFKY